MKICTKCGNECEATTEYFGPRKAARDGLQSQCRVCRRAYQNEHRKTDVGKAVQKRYNHSDKGRATLKRYQRSDKGKATYKRYYAAINGHLRVLFHHMNARCTKRGSYTNKGVKNLFKSLDDLIDHVVNGLKVDPRGLDCHRIDDGGHYERGNITFLSDGEHRKLHRKA